MARLGENRYGKSRVRLSRITRLKDRHEFNEWTVHVLLEGDFEASFTEADNSKVLPTDTMKNTVYFVARDSKAATIEDFAMELGDYLLANNAQVSGVMHRNRRESLGAHDRSTARPRQRPSSSAARRFRPCAPCANRAARGPSRPAWMD